ncbi:MAG: excinuclease ABC subunit C [Candidatus Doudnabacteria bacterium RIFCSPHIGHO2_01_FULL_50_11]|uniref:UvrABC system protein C n=1 Tax=Candidatus Doudnabacteria bacterium RIFCSPHIGHO2_01_FULL_50_11 TaxID=1817828 RepID=A0A1F5PGQ8_9BACT|nr:MAG: excinuclease ABC subunit C [Candidatus Doudnabacteria bacterium RIFCSPHIGHO2_01_FULL_50_11]HLC45224.1 excinuclease ABC subunit UvrC [Patescibacteria group bacterium]
MALVTLKKNIRKLPISPGVYLYRNSSGEVIYVGKAKNLRVRVRSYFLQSLKRQPRTEQLVANIAAIDYVLCDTEVESLMLENNLIKKYQPHYNVLLRDDKNYQFIKIDYSTQIPSIATVRKIDSKKAKFFGPYTSGSAVRNTLRLLRHIFPYCLEARVGSRPCFYYHLGRCPGVCAGIVSVQDYQKTMNQIERFLSGGIQPTLKELSRQMNDAAARKLFEKAARIRDQIRALQNILEKQKIVSPRGETHDVISVVAVGSLAATTVLQIRAGRLIGSENFLLTNAKGATEEEILRAFLEKYYAEASDIPMEIDIPFAMHKIGEITSILSSKIHKKVNFLWPTRGRKRKLLKMAERNAQEHLQKSAQNIQKEQAVITQAMFELRDRLKLRELPFRIEAYDISNLQGTAPTGSMVVFENGKPKKSDYKRFAIRSLTTPNDFLMMEEVLERRFSHTGEQKKNIRRNDSWRLPDLIVIDGGKGQLGVGMKVLRSMGLTIPIIGLAKRLEEIFLPQHAHALRLPADSRALHMLQRIRDEAHRFAVAYHRKKRSKALLS